MLAAGSVHVLLGQYLRGRLLLVGIMSAVTFVTLEWFFRLPYALWIAILTGLLEVIPLVGPLAAAAKVVLDYAYPPLPPGEAD